MNVSLKKRKSQRIEHVYGGGMYPRTTEGQLVIIATPKKKLLAAYIYTY
jgi:hypothetical protein